MPDNPTTSSLKTIISTTQVLQTPEDAELGARVRAVVHTVLDEVEDILTYGSHVDRMTIIKSLLSPAGRLIGVGAGSQKEEARVAFEALMEDIRNVEPQQVLVTETDIIDVDVSAAHAAIDHQDEGSRLPAPRPDDR